MSETRSFFLTGCASGIGQHLADRLVREGHRVYATDLNIDALRAHATERSWPADRTWTDRLDVTDAAAWEEIFGRAIAELEGVDVAANIAGYLNAGRVYEPDPADVDRHVDVNVKGVVYGTEQAARHMAERKSGHIINIASMAGTAPIPGLAVYSGTKYAVRGFSIAAAAELRPYGVAVTAVCPDAVQTPMADRQRGREAAAIMFSSPTLLSVDRVVDAIVDVVLVRRPIEILIPRHRGWLARIADLFPALGIRIAPHYHQRGLKNQRQAVGK